MQGLTDSKCLMYGRDDNYYEACAQVCCGHKNEAILLEGLVETEKHQAFGDTVGSAGSCLT